MCKYLCGGAAFLLEAGGLTSVRLEVTGVRLQCDLIWMQCKINGMQRQQNGMQDKTGARIYLQHVVLHSILLSFQSICLSLHSCGS